MIRSQIERGLGLSPGLGFNGICIGIGDTLLSAHRPATSDCQRGQCSPVTACPTCAPPDREV